MRTTVYAFAAAAMLAVGSPALAQTNLRVSTWLPPSHPIMKDVMAPWGKEVEAATSGRVKVEIMASPIGRPQAQFDLVKDGVADVGYGVHGYTPGRFTLTKLAEVPFLGDSAEEISVGYWRAHEAQLAKANEHEGVELLTVFTHGPGHVFTRNKEVAKVDDFKGLKLRIGGGVIADISEKLGVVGVQAPSTQVFEIVSNGVADGVLFPSESVPFFRVEKAINEGTLVPGGLYNTSFFVVMNKAKFDQLSEADKAAIRKVSGEALARKAGRAWDSADEAGLAAMKSAGVDLKRAPEDFVAALKALLAPIEQKVVEEAKAKGIDGPAALSKIRAGSK